MYASLYGIKNCSGEVAALVNRNHFERGASVNRARKKIKQTIVAGERNIEVKRGTGKDLHFNQDVGIGG